MRVEHDTLGDILVPTSCYWGAQTQRTLQHFAWGTERWPPAFIHAFGVQKWAAAKANASLGLLPEADALMQAAEELSQGQWDEQVPLMIWQSGSGTQIHMNINEVLANRANELLGYPLGSGKPLHPNDHVNRGQSSNDSVPTVMHITLIGGLRDHLFPALETIKDVFRAHSASWATIEKVARTHLQDAVPMTVGQEFSAFYQHIEDALIRLHQRCADLYVVPQGGTAVGTGLNADPLFKERFFTFLCQRTGLPFRPAPNAFAAQASHDALVALSGEFNALACVLYKIANDLRWLTSGPLCGLAELIPPINEPGSSIMPGKANPTQAESLLMVTMQVMGLHHAVTLGGIGNFQLNTAKPLLFYNLWNACTLLASGIRSFSTYYVEGLAPNRTRLKGYISHNPMSLTAQTGELGYEAVAAKIKDLYKH